MPDADPLVLAFDTSAAHCAAVLLRGDEVLAEAAEEMARGQAERLMPLIAEVLGRAGAEWPEIERIGVGIGPGNFTGIRIAVAAARGLALGRGIPAIGVNGFEAAALGRSAPFAVVLPAPRGQGYVQIWRSEEPETPWLSQAPEVDSKGLEIVGALDPLGLARAIARVASTRTPGPRPAPLYLRPADAAPSRDVVPPLLA